MKTTLKIIIIFVILVFIVSCAKEKEITSVDIVIYSPELNEIIQLPDTVSVQFDVTLDKPIEYIRISIDNKDLTPLSKREFIYPEGNSYAGDVNMPIDILPSQVKHPPFTVHFAISDFNKVHHYYMVIELINKEITFKGALFIESKPLNKLDLRFFDAEQQNIRSMNIDGNHSVSAASPYQEISFVATTVPFLVTAINLTTEENIWYKEPQLPYPKTTGLAAYDNIIYISSEIGRVIGLTIQDGSQVFTTLVKKDTIPQNIAITEKYVFTNCNLRNSNNKVWTSYYKETGSSYLTYPTEFETVEMFAKNDNKVIIFGNSDSTGRITLFDVELNTIEDSWSIENLIINNVCKVDLSTYLFSCGNKIYTYNTDYQNHEFVYIMDNIIVDLQYEILSKTIYAGTIYRTDLISFLENTLQTSINSSNELNAIKLIYGY